MNRPALFILGIAKLIHLLTEKYQLFRRMSLVVALYIALYTTWRVFGKNPPDVSGGTAAAYGAVAGLVSAVAILYTYIRYKKGKDDDEV